MKDEYYYCGECGSEVNDEDRFCRICGADLNAADAGETETPAVHKTKEPEDSSPLDQNRTVVLQKYSDEMSAEIAKQVLNQQGISSIISKDDAGGMTPNLQYVYKVRLLVLSKDLNRAREILNIGNKKDSFDGFDAGMFLGLRSVIYHVDNIEKGKEWYMRALGITPYFDKPYYAGFDIGGFEIGLDPDLTDTSVKAAGQIAYWSVSNIEEVFKHLLLIGAQRHEEIKDVGDGVLLASVADPFGNIFGIIQESESN
jgi:predicted enzyme related to lactoylglutathione lyase